MTGATDEELVLAIGGGDTDSLGVLVARWERRLYRFVYRLLPRPDDAREVCQETFLRVLSKAHRFRPGSRYSTWMYQIALNLVRDRERRRRRWSLLFTDRTPEDDVGAAAGTLPAGGEPDAAADLSIKSRAVRGALGRLPREQREVLVLKEYEGLKFREIAELLGCPESTVKSRMYHGLSCLRHELEERGIREP